VLATNLLRENFVNSIWIAVSLACFLWWFLTGVILYIVNWADNKGLSYHRFVTVGLLPVLIVGLYGFLYTLKESSILSVYLSFISALSIWGWLELAFLTGVITGPDQVMRPTGVNGFKRFWLAWRAVAYSEIMLTLVFFILFILSLGEENLFGFFTFLILYFARLSAKLNLFFGVPKINVEFLPARVVHLASHFKVSGISWFFPISVISLIGLVIYWFSYFRISMNIESVSGTIGYSLLLTLTVLAVLEHFFMIITFRDAVLWRWMIPKSQSTKDSDLKRR
jgi:putative photosynthetic complex assembly protein 2